MRWRATNGGEEAAVGGDVEIMEGVAKEWEKGGR